MNVALFSASIALMACSRRLRKSFASNMLTSCNISSLKIAVLAEDSDRECLTRLSNLPERAIEIARGEDVDALRKSNPHFAEAECLLVAGGTGPKLSGVLKEMKNLKWIHGVFAGLDHMKCPEFDATAENNVLVTNAKGVFSSSLAEWVMGAIFYFNKDIKQLNENKKSKKYIRYTVGEIRGRVMGIIGYGDIGRACAKLAKAYGMRVVAHRRRPELSASDPLVDEVFGNDGINQVMGMSDFLVVAAALTPATERMIGEEQLKAAKKGQILINIGRGKLIDEEKLIEALQRALGNDEACKTIAGAALDVFTIEPLPQDSPLWNLDNVLLSPHNADMVENFRHDSVSLFTDNCRKYLAGGVNALGNVVNPKEGY